MQVCMANNRRGNDAWPESIKPYSPIKAKSTLELQFAAPITAGGKLF